MMDKNQAIIDYLCQCDKIKDSPLYFNLINAENDNIQIITTSPDTTYTKPYIDGSVPKKYTCDLVIFKSISESALVNLDNFINENVVDFADAQKLIDWIQEQEDAHNYPNFGSDCDIEEIKTSTDIPRFEGVKATVNPPLAMYSISITINYIDKSKTIWNKS